MLKKKCNFENALVEKSETQQNKNGLIEELYSIINLSEFKWIN